MNTLFKNPGDVYHSYRLENRFVIDELKVVLNVIEHTQAKCKILHIEADDPENLFCLSFQTLPSSSNGVAHILEHTVLCGSKKFPVKDPFFAMQKRSLNTFMNALTGSDFTCYPASSLNKKDFYNLLEVYLDAVFHPLLLENSFLQEGHRLEFATRNDPTTPLEIKGIVYNEMKGSMASADSRLWHTMLKHLTPDLTYAHNSGGDPEEIRHLSYQELKHFFETYYHPSRCLFYFYGNLPIKEHLDFLESKILKDVHPLAPLKPISKQKSFNESKLIRMEIPAPKAEDISEENVIGFGYLTAPISNQLDVLALTLLDSYLMDTDNSKLKKALLDSGLCDSVDGYIDPEMSEVPYVLFCRGVSIDSHEALKKIIHSTLEHVATTGISKKDLEASLHQLEISRTEIGGDGQPFGLTLFMRSALAFQHGVSPEKGLVVHALFDELNIKLNDPHFMSTLIRKYILNNPTSCVLVAKASEDLLERESHKEKQMLEDIKLSLSDEQKLHLVAKAESLNAFQKQQEHQDIECLPKIHLSDVDPLINPIHLLDLKEGLYGYEAFTNGMFYADAILSLQNFSVEELALAPLLAALITEVGLKDQSYEQTLDKMHSFTGGISASCGLYTPVTHPEQVIPVLLIKGKSLKRNKDAFLNLLYQMVYHPRFDEMKRLEELIGQLYSNLQNKFPKHAMRYASQQALSSLSSSGALSNLFFGLPYYEMIKSLKTGGKEALATISHKLKSFHSKWSSDPLCELVVVADKHEVTSSTSHIKSLFSHLKPFDKKTHAEIIPSQLLKEAHIIPSSVAFNVKALKVPGYLHKDAAYLMIAASLMENVSLHSKVREIGGAYGVGSNYAPMSQAFYFHSYRDPHIARTFEAFNQSVADILEAKFSLKELEEAKICIMQSIDSPLSPIAKAISAYTYLKEGRQESMRQNFRTHLLTASIDKVINATQDHLFENHVSSCVSFCGIEIFKKEENLLKNIDLPLAVIPM
jgi:presequence protease